MSRHLLCLSLLLGGCATRPLSSGAPSGGNGGVGSSPDLAAPAHGFDGGAGHDGGAGSRDLAAAVDLAAPRDLTPPPDFAPLPGVTQAPNFRIDSAHTGSQPTETLTPPLTLAWSYKAGAGVTYAVVADGRVFVTDYGHSVVALDRQSGVIIWGPLAVGTMHAYDRGRLFVLTDEGMLTALDAASGDQLWATKLPHQFFFEGPPVAANGIVYVNGTETGGDSYAVDEDSGALIWDNETFDGSSAAVAVANDLVYEAESCLEVSAWNAVTGTTQWHYELECPGRAGAAPAVYQGLVYVRGDASGNDTIFDGVSGAVVGAFTTLVPPAFANGVGYYLQNRTLAAVPVGSSATAWTFTGDGSLDGAPIAAGAYVYMGSALGNLYALDGNGQQVWTTTLGAGINGGSIGGGVEIDSMAVAEGTLFVPAGNVLEAFR